MRPRAARCLPWAILCRPVGAGPLPSEGSQAEDKALTIPPWGAPCPLKGLKLRIMGFLWQTAVFARQAFKVYPNRNSICAGRREIRGSTQDGCDKPRSGHCRPGGGPQGGIPRAAHPKECEFRSKSRVRFELKAAIGPTLPPNRRRARTGGRRKARAAGGESSPSRRPRLRMCRPFRASGLWASMTQGCAELALGFIMPPRWGWRLAL